MNIHFCVTVLQRYSIFTCSIEWHAIYSHHNYVYPVQVRTFILAKRVHQRLFLTVIQKDFFWVSIRHTRWKSVIMFYALHLHTHTYTHIHTHIQQQTNKHEHKCMYMHTQTTSFQGLSLEASGFFCRKDVNRTFYGMLLMCWSTFPRFLG